VNARARQFVIFELNLKGRMRRLDVTSCL
jgi:hypothetical protein